MLFSSPLFFPPSPPPEMFSFHVWRPATASLHISLESGHCYHGRWTILAAIVPPMYTCHSRMKRPLWAHRHTPSGWSWVYGFAECWGSPCVFIEGAEFARPRVCMRLGVCAFWARGRVCVCPHSVSQLSLQSVYIWLQGKSSSKKWILTQWAPHINSFSHIPTQKTTYLHCISPGTPFSFWWWFRDVVEIYLWTSESSQRETVRREKKRGDSLRDGFGCGVRGGREGAGAKEGNESIKWYLGFMHSQKWSFFSILCLPTFECACCWM